MRSVNDTSLVHKTLGVNFSSRGEAEVLVWAPSAKQVVLIVDTGDDTVSMRKEEHGYWSCITGLLKPNDRYWFKLDDQKLPDPASVSQPDGVHGASQVLNLNAFLWTDHHWINYPLEDYIFYELHIGTFTATGNFQQVEEKIDYLKKLGITAIEIMPVAQFPGDRNWGYDGVFPWAVQNSYGGAEALQHLVNKCHEQGIAVVLDVVYNHLGPEGNYLRYFAPYFTEKYKTPWGDAINFDDAGCDGVRHYFIENVLMWFRDFHIDALRLDAVHAIKDFGPKHILKEIRENVDLLMKETGRKHYLIVECDLNDVRYIDEDHGYAMHAQWVDEFHHALRVASGTKQDGYYSDFNGINHLAKSYRDAYVYDGFFSTHRNKKFGTKTGGFEGSKFIVFSQNHDHVGNRMLGERTSTLVSANMQKLLAGAVMVSPFLPLLFMGEEYAETNPFLYFVSHTDPGLIEAVRNGRKKEFSAFHSEGETPDPQSKETFEQSKLQWNLLDQREHDYMFRYYQKLISLRKNLPALNKANREEIVIKLYEEQHVLFLQRSLGKEHVLCIMNFSTSKEKVTSLFDIVGWRKILDSTSSEWGGAEESFFLDGTVTLQPESFLLFTNYV